MNEEFFQVLIDPSKLGDKAENNRLRELSCKTCGHPYAHAGGMCSVCKEKRQGGWYRARQRLESFNMFVHGCPDPVHIFGIGSVDPNGPFGRQFLDG